MSAITGSRRVRMQQPKPESFREVFSSLSEGLRQVSLDLREVVGELRADRVRAAAGKTFGELAAGWHRRVARRRVDKGKSEGRHIEHLAPLAELRESQLTKALIDDLFGRLFADGVLGESTLNKLRGTGKRIVRDAQGNREWLGLNPFELTERMREPELVWETLSLGEAMPVVRGFELHHQAMVKTILMIGLRPGEAFALLKTDVDLERRILKVKRSHGRNRTKTGKERDCPIPDALVDDLRRAMEESACAFVFPKPGTSERRSKNSRLSDRMKTALKRAGVVSGWRFRCRKYSCPFKDDVVREKRDALPCPRCEKPMWSVGIPKPLRFYDLRHTSSTLHREAKCDPLVIQQMLGHAPRNTTDSDYTHLSDGYRLAEVNKLKLDTGERRHRNGRGPRGR